MTWPKVNPPQWAVGATLTSAQMNQMDSDHSLSAQDVQLAAHALSNWQPPANASSIGPNFFWQAAAYDSTAGVWVATINDSISATQSHAQWWSIDGGKTWSQQLNSSVSTLIFDSIAAAGGYSAVVSLASSGSTAVTVWNLSTNVVVSPLNVLGSLTSSGIFWFAPASLWILIGSAFSAGTSTLTAADATQLAPSWTTITGSLPFATTSGGVGKIMTASSATTTAVALSGLKISTGGAGTFGANSRLIAVTYPASVLTFTDVTPAVASGKTITGLTYDSVNALWGLQVWNGSNGLLYTSPDLSTWTLVRTFAAGLFQPVGLAAVSGVWISGVAQAFNGTFVERTQLSRNIQLGAGSTWQYTNGALSQIAQFFSGPSQVLALAPLQVSVSLQTGMV